MEELSPKIPAAILSVIATFGMFGNFNIIVATVRTSSLRTTCNYLIAFTALFDFIHQLSQYVVTYFAFVGDYPTIEKCFCFQFLPMIGCNAAEVAMLFTSLDRLYCVARPVAYQHVSCALEIPICVAVSLFFGLWINYESYMSFQSIRFQTTVCTLGSCYNEALEAVTISNGLIHLATIFIYGIIFIVIKKITKQKASGMLRSIAAVTFCVVGGWLLTMVLFEVFLSSGIPVSDALILYLGIPLNISISLNYPIYFLMSSRYRVVFKEQLNLLRCRNFFGTTVQEVSNTSSGGVALKS
ncbi:unnamed protein product [Bursaphelenchus xylophilus]|uniref:(pine wood nematode) hypothetical protein n=1 Tax=Bursaphelenchus xylophilus TaxID=6326 RepID=A0A1I7SUV1_BURXY|nr:unnamed protein product [Bursaphelenchus xylophilus]CAG9125861.1 unnamed protein product [Bursaphelenchus xylophilus]